MAKAWNTNNGESYRDGDTTMTPAELRVWTRWAEQGQLCFYLEMEWPLYRRMLAAEAAKL